MGMGQNTTQTRPFPWPLVFVGVGVLLIVLVLGGTVATNSPLASPTPTAKVLPQVERITIDKAYRAFENYQAVFLDVRDVMSYEAGHIVGAIHIPLNQLDERLGELAPESWIITYCT
jgi:hypothetical protein